MIKVKVGTTWKFNYGDGCIQQVIDIKNNKCEVVNIKGNALWGRPQAISVDISYIENALNTDSDYRLISHYNTKLGKILYK